MGKSIVFNDDVGQYLNNAAKSPVYHTGLLIGTSTPQHDVVVHLTPTPKKEEVDNGEVEDETSKEKDKESGNNKKKKKSKSAAAKKEELIDELWIYQHVKQVNRMLPGGLDILGIFVYAPTETYSKMLPTVRQVMFSAFKPLMEQKLGLCNNDNDRIQLHICSVTQKVTCRTLDVADYKSTVKPAEWVPAGSVYWNQLDTEFRLDQWIPVEQDHVRQSLLSQIQGGLQPLFTSVLNATMLFNNQLRPKEEALQGSREGVAGKKGKQAARQANRELKKFKVDLFLPLPESNNTKGAEITECGASMQVCGTIHCRAFTHGKATVEEATRAVQQDILRSITARCEIQCEEMLLIDEEQQDPTLVHELPRRVFANLPGQDLCVSDYIYRGDSATDSLEAFHELLNLELDQEDIDTNCEQSPGCHDLDEQDMEERLSEAGEQVMEAINSRRNIIVPLASAAVIAIATGVSYFFFQDSI